MNQNRSEQMVNRLRSMQAAAPDIEASAIVSVDGLIIASALPAEVEEDRVSAMSAAMLSLGERIAEELGRGGLSQVYIKGSNGFIVLTSVGSEAVLTALARQAWDYFSGDAPGCRGPGQIGRMKLIHFLERTR
jgi:predicted regulator of Ras-like GTPase activity (Roadblock/LC7/MglB family)